MEMESFIVLLVELELKLTLRDQRKKKENQWTGSSPESMGRGALFIDIGRDI